MALGAVLLRGRGDPAHLPDRRGLELPAARRARRSRSRATPFPHRWAVMFLVAVGFWNFLGAGIFGFLINLPIVSYYEIGTALTANHGHAAMMGVYGMLAVGLALFCLRYLIPRTAGPTGRPRSASGRSTSGSPGCASRRCSHWDSSSSMSRSTTATSRRASLEFLTNSTNTLIEWLRFPGDVAVHRRRGAAADLHLLAGGAPSGAAVDTGGARGHPLHRCHGAGDGGRFAMTVEAIAAAGYAAFLVVVALGLDNLGRHTHDRSGRFRTQGFSYHPGLDLWECPEGEQLRPFGIDHQRRVARYRAKPTSATTARPRTAAPTRTRVGRSSAPWIPGLTRRRGASTAASRSPCSASRP